MIDIHDAADYLILKAFSNDVCLNIIKLENLLYYCQAFWFLEHEEPLFKILFIKGPYGAKVKEIQERFISLFTIFDPLRQNCVKNQNPLENESEEIKFWIDCVFDTFASWGASQLTDLVEKEDPYNWLESNIINEEVMKIYYRGITKMRKEYPQEVQNKL